MYYKYVITGRTGSGKFDTANYLKKTYNYIIAKPYLCTQERSRYLSKNYQLLGKRKFKTLSSIVNATISGKNIKFTKDILDQSDIVIMDINSVSELRKKYPNYKLYVIDFVCSEDSRVNRLKSRSLPDNDIKNILITDNVAYINEASLKADYVIDTSGQTGKTLSKYINKIIRENELSKILIDYGFIKCSDHFEDVIEYRDKRYSITVSIKFSDKYYLDISLIDTNSNKRHDYTLMFDTLSNLDSLIDNIDDSITSFIEDLGENN